MTFRLLAPQDAVDEAGRRVFTTARDRIAFEAGGVRAEAEVEFASAKFGALTTLYRSSLIVRGTDSARPSESEIVAAIIDGLTAMGSTVEVVE